MKKNQMLKYILPGIVGLLFNSLYIIVDGIFVANILGSNALAAVTIVVPIVEILIALSLMVSIGCGVYISANMGRKKEKEARGYFNNGLTLMLGLSLVITTLFLLFNKKRVGFLGATDLILEETREYHEGLKSGKYKRAHSYSLTYAKKEVNENQKKFDLAIRLWG